MRKIILKLDLHDDKANQQKAMKMVSRLTGIDSIAMDMKEKKLTVVGDIDPIDVVTKLRKVWRRTEILSVGPAKEPQKKQIEGKNKDPNDEIAELVKLYKTFNPHITTHYYVQSLEEDPNACVIC